jgi:HAD superfamily hydrolase (TIGR01509 family)
MNLSALIFDVDGTLVDTEELHRQAFNQAFLDFELGWDWTPEIYADLLRNSGGANRIHAYIKSLSLPHSRAAYLRQIVPMIHREKTLIYTDLVDSSALRPRAGIARLIDEALRSEVKVGLVATSALRDVRGLVSSTLGKDVAETVEPVVCAELVANKKPAPDIYLLALNMLRLPADVCVAFEDSANGLAAAKAASLCTIVTPSNWTRTQKFIGADLMLSTLGDPDRPVSESDSASIGGRRYLELKDIEALIEKSAWPHQLH